MAALLEAYITNLGKYAEGQLVGETLKFPATTEEVQSLLKNIGVDGVRYEEFFITAFDGDVMGLYDYLTEYENLDELNHLAHLISELDSDEIETLEAVLNKGDHTSSVADIINLVHNLDCYELHPGVTDDETLGRIYVEDMELLDVPDNVLPYFDFEAYGRDICLCRPGRRSRWIRCGSIRPSAAAGSVRSVDKKAAALCPSSCDGNAGGTGIDR